MSNKEEQVKPLAPAAVHGLDFEAHDAIPVEFMAGKHRRCIKWGGCFFAILLIIVMVLLVLMLTVFRVKDPVLNVNYVNIQGVDNRTDFGSSLNYNVTLEALVSIKNPNVASFKFSNMTMNVYHNGSIIGETWTPPGEVGARRTVRINLSIELRADDILRGGLGTLLVPISSNTRISGRVKISSRNKRSLIVNMNCTMNVNKALQEELQDRRKMNISCEYEL